MTITPLCGILLVMPSSTSHHAFSIKEAIIFGWDTVKEHFLVFVGIWGIVFVVNGIAEVLSQSFNDTAPFLSFVSVVSAWVVLLVIMLGSIRIALKLAEGKKPHIHDLFSSYHMLLFFVIGFFLYMCIVLVGMVLFVIPGIIWAIQFRFFPFLLVEKNVGILEAFEKSSKMTKGVKWHLFWFYLSLGGIVLVSAFTIVGVLLTIPIALVSAAHVYHKLDS